MTTHKPIFLDESGKPSVKVVVRNDRPTPEKRWVSNCELGLLRSTIRSLKPGESFDTLSDGKSALRAAQQVNVKITTRKMNGSGYTVWRKAP